MIDATTARRPLRVPEAAPHGAAGRAGFPARTAQAGLMLVAGLLLTLGGAAAAAAAAPPSTVAAQAPEPGVSAVSQPSATMLPEPAWAGRASEGSRGALAAPAPGSGGWCWPIGTEDFKGWSGWLAPRGSYVHVAQDMPCSLGHPVYAIADGVVFISRADAGGYGVGGSDGGCMIVTHVTAAGTRFHALYGHVSGLRFKEGQRVNAGDVIAKVNGCRHLHFSIHPGSTYRDRNPYAGHVPKSWADHGGFVDPVRFLKTNPRAAGYRPPPLPRVEIVTTSPPLQYGATEGAAYWTEEGAAGAVTYRYDLATGARRVLANGEAAPAFDAERFGVEPLAAPAVGFSVSDRLPVLSLSVAHSTPEWGASVQPTATLANAGGAVVRGGLVRLERLRGEAWVEVRFGVSGRTGRAAFSLTPTRRTTLRVTFAPPADEPEQPVYLAARSRTLVVTPHALVAMPRLPAKVRRNEQFTVAGYLTPRHTAGENSVDLVFQRRGASGAWVTRLAVDALNRDAGPRTRYVRAARLPAAGAWRVQAVHPADEDHAHTYSTWRSFTVE